jgi:hypothetical protein
MLLIPNLSMALCAGIFNMAAAPAAAVAGT